MHSLVNKLFHSTHSEEGQHVHVSYRICIENLFREDKTDLKFSGSVQSYNTGLDIANSD